MEFAHLLLFCTKQLEPKALSDLILSKLDFSIMKLESIKCKSKQITRLALILHEHVSSKAEIFL